MAVEQRLRRLETGSRVGGFLDRDASKYSHRVPAVTGLRHEYEANLFGPAQTVHLRWNEVPGAEGYEVYARYHDDASLVNMMGTPIHSPMALILVSRPDIVVVTLTVVTKMLNGQKLPLDLAPSVSFPLINWTDF